MGFLDRLVRLVRLVRGMRLMRLMRLMRFLRFLRFMSVGLQNGSRQRHDKNGEGSDVKSHRKKGVTDEVWGVRGYAGLCFEEGPTRKSTNRKAFPQKRQDCRRFAFPWKMYRRGQVGRALNLILAEVAIKF